MPNHIECARNLITDRLGAIEAEAGKLKRALEELGERDGAAPASAKPRRKRGPGKRRRPQAPRGQRREQLLAAIAAKPGARTSARRRDWHRARPGLGPARQGPQGQAGSQAGRRLRAEAVVGCGPRRERGPGLHKGGLSGVGAQVGRPERAGLTGEWAGLAAKAASPGRRPI